MVRTMFAAVVAAAALIGGSFPAGAGVAEAVSAVSRANRVDFMRIGAAGRLGIPPLTGFGFRGPLGIPPLGGFGTGLGFRGAPSSITIIESKRIIIINRDGFGLNGIHRLSGRRTDFMNSFGGDRVKVFGGHKDFRSGDDNDLGFGLRSDSDSPW